MIVSDRASAAGLKVSSKEAIVHGGRVCNAARADGFLMKEYDCECDFKYVSCFLRMRSAREKNTALVLEAQRVCVVQM